MSQPTFDPRLVFGPGPAAPAPAGSEMPFLPPEQMTPGFFYQNQELFRSGELASEPKADAQQPENMEMAPQNNAPGVRPQTPYHDAPANIPAIEPVPVALPQPLVLLRESIPANGATSFYGRAGDLPAGMVPVNQGERGVGVGVPTLGAYTEEEAQRYARQVAEERERRRRGPQERRTPPAGQQQLAPQGVKKSSRPGPPKAAPGQQKYNWCFKEHQRSCEMERGCSEKCPLKKYWPEKWAQKEAQEVKVTLPADQGEVLTNGLWVWKWENADNRKDKRRRVD